MRRLAIAMFALVSLVSSSERLSAQSYPWSAESAGATRLNQIPANSALNLIPTENRAQQRSLVPPAPLMKRIPIFASNRRSQQEPQSSLSDLPVADYIDQPAPTPVQSNGANAYQNVIDAQNPALSIQDTTSEGEPSYCCRNCRRGCDLGCVKRLFGRNARGLQVGGWISAGYHNRDTIIFNDRKGTVNPQQVWLYAEKLAPRRSGWGIGYRLDTLYGLDAQKVQSFGNGPAGAPDGWDNSWDYGAFGWALPQTYIQLANQCWDVKVGKFFSPYGYERVQAPENFFYSHSYTFRYVQPLTMTGVLGEKRLAHNRSFLLGVSTGWDTGFERTQGGFNAITGFRAELNDFMKVSILSSWGDTGYRNSGGMTSGVAEVQLTDRVRYVFQGSGLNLQGNNEFGFTNYLFRDISCCLGLGARLEWWKSDQIFPDTKSTWEFTMGANYRTSANFVLRPEVRWDWGAGAIEPGQAIVGIDGVLLF